MRWEHGQIRVHGWRTPSHGNRDGYEARYFRTGRPSKKEVSGRVLAVRPRLTFAFTPWLRPSGPQLARPRKRPTERGERGIAPIWHVFCLG